MGIGPSDEIQALDSAATGQNGSYKPSRYNHFASRGETVWGVNFLSGAFVRLDRAAYRKVRQVLDGERAGPLAGVRRDLIRGRFLIPEEMEELDYLKTKNYMSRFSNKGLTLIVAPTLRCNFGCRYCYVDKNANKMKKEARIRLARFFDRKLPDGTPARVVWTGGDPSLAMDVVEDLSHRFLESCARKKSPYLASLITNGYLLNARMREKLRSSRVGRLQVSLDGSRELHDASRCLPNGSPTYDRILGNVSETCDELEVSLRINVTVGNHAAIPDLLDDIESRGMKEKVLVYFACVNDVNENSAAFHGSCLKAREYGRIEASLLRRAAERGFRIGSGGVLRKPVNTFCGANSRQYYVVDPKANLQKCYHDFGNAAKHGVGRIGADGDEIITNRSNLFRWLGWSPFENEECRSCKVLPLCMGGCSHIIMSNGMNVTNGCIKLRFSMDEIVALYGELKTDSVGCSGCAGAAVV